MKQSQPKNLRILSIAPSARGFGFAVLDEQGALVNWGTTRATKDINAGCLKKVNKLMDDYEPGVIVLEDASAKDSRRAPRIRELTNQIVAAALSRHFKVVLFSRKQIHRKLHAGQQATKHMIAQIIAERFPEELKSLLPSKRRPWESEDDRMDIFDAVALAVVSRVRKQKRSD